MADTQCSIVEFNRRLLAAIEALQEERCDRVEQEYDTRTLILTLEIDGKMVAWTVADGLLPDPFAPPTITRIP